MRSRPSVLHGVRERDLRTPGFAVAMLIDNAWADAEDLIDDGPMKIKEVDTMFRSAF